MVHDRSGAIGVASMEVCKFNLVRGCYAREVRRHRRMLPYRGLVSLRDGRRAKFP